MSPNKNDGPAKRGRKPDASSKSGRIRALLSSGMSPGDIAKKIGCTPALVYNVRARVEGGGGKRRGRKSKKGRGGDGIANILEAVQASDRERSKMRSALERIQGLVADALG